MAQPGPTTNVAVEAAVAAPGSAPGIEEHPAVHPAYSTGGIALDSLADMLFEPPPRGRGCLFTAWVFCAVGTITLLIPLGFTLLPLLGPSRLQRTVTTAPARSPTVATATAVTTAATTTTTVIPLTCVKPTPVVSDNMDGIDANTTASIVTVVPNYTAPVYCLYNNSRIRKSFGYDFLPVHMPWECCPNVVYWSIGLSKTGLLVMRAPKFDHFYGLMKLRNIINDRRPDAQIIVTIGGYPEDSGLLYQLGPGTRHEHNLAQLLLENLHKYKFHGLNIHLVEDAPCETYFKEKFQRLTSLIDTFVSLVNLNYAKSPYTISIMVGTDTNLANQVLREMGAKINVLFFDSHQLVSKSRDTYIDGYCQDYGDSTNDLFSNSFGVKGWKGRLCGSLSFLFPSRKCDVCQELGAALPLTRREGTASYLDLCALNYTEENPKLGYSGCDTIVANRKEPVVYLQALSELSKAFSNGCVLLDSVDYDAVPKGCRNFRPWRALDRFHRALRRV